MKTINNQETDYEYMLSYLVTKVETIIPVFNAW